ncbi:hypothetical protein [Solidesulfovibrio sp. C21]
MSIRVACGPANAWTGPSAGCEDAADIIADLGQALDAAGIA